MIQGSPLYWGGRVLYTHSRCVSVKQNFYVYFEKSMCTRTVHVSLAVFLCVQKESQLLRKDLNFAAIFIKRY